MSPLFESFSQSLGKVSNLVVAFSGGVDSTVLLHLAQKYRQLNPSVRISAVHINHQISTNSSTWAQHCKNVCDNMRIPFECHSVDIKGNLQMGVEGAARKARYDALLSNCPHGASILLGQHSDDQAETFLLQTARGAGPKGLSAMGQYHSLQGKSLIRPLLNVSQSDILAYAQTHHLSWVEDESNQNTDFDRNYIRNEVLPRIQKRWPSFSSSVVKSARMCASEMRVLNEYMELLSKDLLGKNNILLLSPLEKLAKHTKASFVRYWLDIHNVLMPSERVLDEILNMHAAKDDANPTVVVGKVKIRRYMQALYVDTDENTCENIRASQCPLIDIDESDKRVRLDKLFVASGEFASLHISLLQTGENAVSTNAFSASDITSIKIAFGKLTERFKPYANRPAKKIKSWCKEWEIPPWQRKRLALIFADDSLIGMVNNNATIIWSSERSIDQSKSLFIAELSIVNQSTDTN